MLNKLISLFRSGDKSFNEIEQKILQATIAALPEGLSAKLVNRCDAINLIQRYESGKEVNCYQMVKGKAVLPRDHKLMEKTADTILAHFSITIDGKLANNGKLWLIDGVFFSIEFNSSPHQLDITREYEVFIELNNTLK